MSARDTVIAIIHQEHKSLLTVLWVLDEMLARVDAGHSEPEFALFATALLYIDDFQERNHHPKEEDFLFKTLLARTRACDAAIARLHAEHIAGAEDVRHLHRLLVRYQGGARDGMNDFHVHVGAYAARMHEHMRQEEKLLREALAVLTGDDWAHIAGAFARNDDPLFGANRALEYNKLYHRVMMLAPRKLKPGIGRAAHLHVIP